MAWCCSPEESVAAMLSTDPCVSSHLWFKWGNFQVSTLGYKLMQLKVDIDTLRQIYDTQNRQKCVYFLSEGNSNNIYDDKKIITWLPLTLLPPPNMSALLQIHFNSRLNALLQLVCKSPYTPDFDISSILDFAMVISLAAFSSFMSQYIVSNMLQSYLSYSWWRHQMKTISALLAICAGNSPVPGEFPAQRPVARSFDVYFDLRPNKRLSKQ